MPRKNYRERPSGCFSAAKGEFTYPYPDALFDSDAYKILSHANKLILLDMVRQYLFASRWQTIDLQEKDLAKKGFSYTWKTCRLPIAESTFREAIAEILRIGFFDAPKDIQVKGDPVAYIPLLLWRSYKTTKAERKALDTFDRRKKSRTARHADRKLRFQAFLASKNNAQPR